MVGPVPEQNPTHIYTGDGTYTVTLTVTEANGNSNTKTKSGYITVVDTGPVSNFSATSTSGNEPLSVTFTNTSTSYDGIASWAWNFGDGGTGTEQNPTHIYTDTGIYTVTLTVTEADGDSNTKTKTDYIAVGDTEPTADFSTISTSGDKPLSVTFTDASTSHDGVISWSWDFGDGGTSTEQNPTHIYTGDGTYTVTLSVTEADGDSNTKTKTGYIAVDEKESTDKLTVTDILAKQTVYPGNVAKVETKDKKIIVQLSVESVGTEGEVIIHQETKDSLPSAPTNFKAGSTCFSIEATCGLNKGASITITVAYSQADVNDARGNASLLALSRYDEVTGEWVVLPTIVDTKAQTLTTTTNHLSKWMVMVKPPSSSSSSALPIILGWTLGGLALATVSVFGYLTWKRRKT